VIEKLGFKTMADASESSAGCSHIVNIKADANASTQILNKYKSVVAWNVNHLHGIKNTAKRRKVWTFWSLCANLGNKFYLGIFSSLCYLWTGSIASICVFALFICRLLVRRSRLWASEGRKSPILLVKFKVIH